jgi:hypothetical protein
VQFNSELAPADEEYVPTRQDIQLETDSAFKLVEYVPATQFVQVESVTAAP